MRGAPRLIGLPYDASSSFMRGAAEAPPLIRAALHSPAGNSWTEGLADLSRDDGLGDAGDIQLLPTDDARMIIEREISDLMAAGYRPIALGGDHSVTYPIMRAIQRKHREATILHVDAHPDLYEHFQGDRYSHACPFARILEEKLAVRLVQVGIRTMNGHQRAQADRYGVEVVDMRAWSSGVRPRMAGEIYLSIDLDGIDPAHAPGVSHREPGGLTVRDVLSMIQELPDSLVAADIVEYNPRRDLDGVTASVAAKLAKEVAARMLIVDR